MSSLKDTVDSAKWRVLLRRFLTRGGNGIGQPVSNGQTVVTVNLPKPEGDALYGVVVTPAWSTTAYVSSKTTNSFTVSFGTGPVGSSTFDWIVFRSE